MVDVIFPDELVEEVKAGSIGILPTEKMYGVLGSALNDAAVDRIFELRDRDRNKPVVILIADVSDLDMFGAQVSLELLTILNKIWPGHVTVRVPVDETKFRYLPKNEGTLAFRLPDDEKLREFVRRTGPLVAPSANPSGEKPAETLDEAWDYFPELDFYIDGGTLPNNPSTLIGFEEDTVKVFRQGSWQVPEDLLEQ